MGLAMILQSRMNIDYCKYDMARKYIEALPYDQWVMIQDLPEQISFEIIDLIDKWRGSLKIVFSECFDKFLVTRCIPEIATLHLTRYYNSCVPIKKRDRSSNFKGVSWHKPRLKYDAYIVVENKKYHLGSYKNEKHAAIAYQIAKLNLYRYYGRE